MHIWGEIAAAGRKKVVPVVGAGRAVARDLDGRRSAGPMVDDVERAAAAAAMGAMGAGVEEVVWKEEG